MARKKSRTAKKKTPARSSRKPASVKQKPKHRTFDFRKTDGKFGIIDPEVHVYGKNSKVCSTNARGHETPQDRSPLEILVDASDGFIPLWAENVTLRWRFNESSMEIFQNPLQAKEGIRELFGEALLKWGDAVPITFKETSDTWDFEIAMSSSDKCNANGCTLARAFFPDAGRHDLMLYPILFNQSQEEQLETFIHEIGHVFGLRHFFANVSEKSFPSEIFGTHDKFSIMNYGEESILTENDVADLKQLYSEVWSGDRTEINGTPIVMFHPFHEAQNETLPTAANLQIAAGNRSSNRAIRELLIQLLKQR